MNTEYLYKYKYIIISYIRKLNIFVLIWSRERKNILEQVIYTKKQIVWTMKLLNKLQVYV